MNGLFDLPGRVFDRVDVMLAWALPSGGRIVFWGVIAALLSMGLYWLLSPQTRIARAKADALRARRELEAHEGALAEAGPLIRAQFAAVFRQIGLVLPVTLIAMLPVLSILVWADARYGYLLPEDANAVPAPPITVSPALYTAEWALQAPRRSVVVRDAQGAAVLEIPVTQPVPVVEKRRWWHRLFGNPLGYLPDEGEVERVQLHLGAQRHLPFGPDWLGSWLALFVPALALTSLAVFRIGRLH